MSTGGDTTLGSLDMDEFRKDVHIIGGSEKEENLSESDLKA